MDEWRRFPGTEALEAEEKAAESRVKEAAAAALLEGAGGAAAANAAAVEEASREAAARAREELEGQLSAAKTALDPCVDPYIADATIGGAERGAPKGRGVLSGTSLLLPSSQLQRGDALGARGHRILLAATLQNAQSICHKKKAGL